MPIHSMGGEKLWRVRAMKEREFNCSANPSSSIFTHRQPHPAAPIPLEAAALYTPGIVPVNIRFKMFIKYRPD